MSGNLSGIVKKAVITNALESAMTTALGNEESASANPFGDALRMINAQNGGTGLESNFGENFGESVAKAAAAATSKATRRRTRAMAPMGVTETPKRRRRGGARVSTFLSDLNEDRLGG